MSKNNPLLEEYVSIVIVPPGGHKTRSIRISKKWCTRLLWGIPAAGTLLLIWGIFLGISSYKYYTLGPESMASAEQESKMRNYVTDIRDLKESMETLLEKEAEIKTMLDMESSQKKKDFFHRQAQYKISDLDSEINRLLSEDPKSQLPQSIGILKTETKALERRYAGFVGRAQTIKQRFNATPSIWPLYGRIASGFGWRLHPYTMQRRFHQGVDVPSWTGAPIRASADGVVASAGWGDGYGLMVTLDHGYGYRTVYGHASKLLVQPGQRIKKGQIIAKVGSTGISTGPHVHYEVRRWGRPISPYPYLGLDLATAKNKVW